jgi:hypothetical protein
MSPGGHCVPKSNKKKKKRITEKIEQTIMLACMQKCVASNCSDDALLPWHTDTSEQLQSAQPLDAAVSYFCKRLRTIRGNSIET